jgi:hypothetical protein
MGGYKRIQRDSSNFRREDFCVPGRGVSDEPFTENIIENLGAALFQLATLRI